MSVLVSGTSLSKALVNLSHSGLSKLSLNSLSFYFVGQTEPKILRLVYFINNIPGSRLSAAASAARPVLGGAGVCEVAPE